MDPEVARALQLADALLAEVDAAERDAIAARLRAHGDNIDAACAAEEGALVLAGAALTKHGWVVQAPPLDVLARVYAVAAQLAAPQAACIRLAEHAFKLAHTERVIGADREQQANAQAAERSETARRSALHRPVTVDDATLLLLDDEYTRVHGAARINGRWKEIQRQLARQGKDLSTKQIAHRIGRIRK